jgi:hypothetical protein
MVFCHSQESIMEVTIVLAQVLALSVATLIVLASNTKMFQAWF